MIHAKKCEPEYFNAVASGEKPFEVRVEDETARFLVGDFLALNEYGDIDGHGRDYTGRSCLLEITYTLRDPRFVKEGTVILGVRPCTIIKAEDCGLKVTARELFTADIYGRKGGGGA